MTEVHNMWLESHMQPADLSGADWGIAIFRRQNYYTHVQKKYDYPRYDYTGNELM